MITVGRYVYDYGDLEESLEEVDNTLCDLKSTLDDFAYCNYDLYSWDKGNYEDVSGDLNEKCESIRKEILDLIDIFNRGIDNTFEFNHVEKIIVKKAPKDIVKKCENCIYYERFNSNTSMQIGDNLVNFCKGSGRCKLKDIKNLSVSCGITYCDKFNGILESENNNDKEKL